MSILGSLMINSLECILLFFFRKCDKRTECLEYYKDVLAYVCGSAAVLGLLTLATLQCNRRTTQQLNKNT